MYHGNFRATVNTSGHEDSFAICDLCGFLWNHSRLSFQWDYGGAELINLGILVCPDCLDIPFLPRKTILLPADPIPIENPRPPSYTQQEGYTDPTIPNPWPDQPITNNEAFLETDSAIPIVTQNGLNIAAD